MPNFEPLVLPRETVAAIEKLRKNKNDDAHIIAIVVEASNISPKTNLPEATRDLMKVNVNRLMQALVVGYVPEPTLEEELGEVAEQYKKAGNFDFMKGLATTLKLLGKHEPQFAHLDKWANEEHCEGVAAKEVDHV